MNQSEFIHWITDFRDRLPDTDAWLHRLPNQSIMLSSWYEALSDVELADAIEATRMVIRGDLEISNFERDKTAAKIRITARALAGKRRQIEERHRQAAEFEQWSKERESRRLANVPSAVEEFRLRLRTKDSA